MTARLPRPSDVPDSRPPVVMCDEPGSFAWGVLHRRHPALIQQVRDAFPYAPRQHRALDALLAEITDGVVEPLDATAKDHALWAERAEPYLGRSWFDAPFLWAESYFYRKLLAALEYFGEGPWQGVDPFGPFKDAELSSTVVDEELRALDTLADLPAERQASALLQASLWGNRADLGFSVTADESARTDTDGGADAGAGLVADDSALLWSLLPVGTPATVAVVADNAGRELIPDLVLVDHLLERGHATDVVLHVKPYPYYVSDATTTDVVGALRRLVRASGRAGEIGRRLWTAAGTGRLEVRAHPFFCAPLPYEEMPEDLRTQFASVTLTILKGDLNYRRLVGDRLWPATTPFADVTAYFPGSVAALRTLKSDVIVGLTAAMTDALDRTGAAWRTSGTHALIQARPAPAATSRRTSSGAEGDPEGPA
ncbi:damage-control phosphatase ARMT1 family protein [Streptomyces sp. AM8-1-1]|uniref:damage-control phosphatase ARMT1 family protein n=1 Tax=Streptomyces sp. AM8-1-1 TaxID=3075825 RepID=UPI0028C3E074|nr:damage-control phosphatase ARMT1 family protein [Streptomyces sp. AM8-1-1]WNO70977.1 damage-control phosphatase ARMT1 family protein [Streptomyces sp. AM8-1-1]